MHACSRCVSGRRNVFLVIIYVVIISPQEGARTPRPRRSDNMQFVDCETVLFTTHGIGVFEYASSEEPSPIKLGGECARSGPPRNTRAHDDAPMSRRVFVF